MKKEPNFQPLSMILTVFMVEKGLLDSSKQQLENIKAVENKPHVLDDEIIKRSLRLYTEQNEDTKVVFEQCKRWREENPSEEQLTKIEEIEEIATELVQVNNEILAIMNRCKEQTIERLLEKEDLEVGLEYIVSKMMSK